MGYYEQKSGKRLLSTLDNNSLVMLIIIHLVIFVLFSLVNVFYFFTFTEDAARIKFFEDIYANLAIPARFSDFLKKPWTLFTHMFYHFEVWHLISNMIWLWIFGYILHDMTGNRKIIPIFIYGGLGGAAAYLLSYNLIPVLHAFANSNAIGASAGVMAVAVATTMISPGYRIFPFINGGIPLWIITMIFVIIDLAALPINNHGGHIAHLGGALSGYLFIVFYRNGYDGSAWMNNFYDWFTNLFNPEKPPRSAKRAREKLYYKSSDDPYKKTMNLTQQRVDEILDKISQTGYGSLTSEEKELLKRASKEDL